LRLAGEQDVDLVEIVAQADPPVCRLMDYGKFKYQEQKRAAEAKAKQKVIEVKEVKFRPGRTVNRGQAYKSNIRTKKSTKTKRHLRGAVTVHETNMGHMAQMLPFAGL
jgi:translation initiation factor IF-3